MTGGDALARGSTGRWLVGILCGLLAVYRATISLFLPPSCRFTPTCSEYAAAALRKYGIFRGSLKSIARILRCAPWSPGGIDEP
jgi:hypothetical protein